MRPFIFPAENPTTLHAGVSTVLPAQVWRDGTPTQDGISSGGYRNKTSSGAKTEGRWRPGIHIGETMGQKMRLKGKLTREEEPGDRKSVCWNMQLVFTERSAGRSEARALVLYSGVHLLLWVALCFMLYFVLGVLWLDREET